MLPDGVTLLGEKVPVDRHGSTGCDVARPTGWYDIFLDVTSHDDVILSDVMILASVNVNFSLPCFETYINLYDGFY